MTVSNLKKPELQVKGIPAKRSDNPFITPDVVDHLNYRIEQEEYSSRIYLAMSMWLNNEGYTGASSLWKNYSQEELVHADYARTYLLSFGIQPLTPALKQPQQIFSGLPEIIEMSYDHEIEVTRQAKELADSAFKSGDHILYELALKYLREQVEEHDKTQTWLDKIATFGTTPVALKLLDNEMGG